MNNSIEILRPSAVAHHARVALFDFDGTLSIIRSGWEDVMIPMMVEALVELKTGESEEALTAVVKEFVGRLTGKQTIYQMIELCDQIKARGGTPADPLVYKHRYLDLLLTRIQDRLDDLRSGRVAPDQWLVPGSRGLLEGLKERGFKLYLASGTDDQYVKDEANLLDVTRYFDGGVYGALDDYKTFSKAILIKRLIEGAGFRGEEFLGFGDGYVEIENVKQVGGITVGIASDEPECQIVNAWKRDRLIKVGADYIVPNFAAHKELFDLLFPN
ncbi:MAG TPA: HAD family hydrolase [Bryobacteraceae bacterium]|nr:haloacid dehalogenase [Bryobacterales bacterium]HRJ20885.1 HAD family hydrolase [Bryobacteraceae bacterium]